MTGWPTRHGRPRDGKRIPQLLEHVDELVVELLLRVAAPAVVQEALKRNAAILEVAARPGLAKACVVQAPGEAFFSQKFRESFYGLLDIELVPDRSRFPRLSRSCGGRRQVHDCGDSTRGRTTCALRPKSCGLRSFSSVKVDDERGVVVFRRRVTDGAIVTLGRVDERRVDAWDWALALSGIFVV